MIILSTIIGFISSAIPELMKFWQDRSDKRHEIKLLEMQIEANKQQHVQKLAEIDVQADIADSKAAHTPQRPIASIIKDDQELRMHWVDALNATVRPVIAYSFFALYAAVKFLQWKMLPSQLMPWQIDALWGDEDAAIFAGIIAFYFGQRAMGKVREIRNRR